MICEGARDLRNSARPEDQAGLQSAILAVPNKPLTLAYRETQSVSCLVPLLGQLTVTRLAEQQQPRVVLQGRYAGHTALRLRRLGSIPSQAGQ